MISPHEPFLRSIPKRWIPREMTTAPVLDPGEQASAIEPHYALLINPFYPKDPAGSFGKHVLTPSLALSSLAAVTPREWSVRVWDENLLQGSAPIDPLPQVVGITVHVRRLAQRSPARCGRTYAPSTGRTLKARI
jgi:hypothetical protein